LLDLLHAWILFPAALGLAGYGLGLLVEEACARPIAGALLVPLGLAAVIVLGSIITSSSATADLAVPVIAVLAVIGLVRHGRSRRLDRWALSAAIGVLLVYGAPVLLSGQATFTGFITLDDTSTWLAFTDQVMSHGRAFSNLPPSTYALILQSNIGSGYPLGAFVGLGVGRALVDMDAAWVFQPYMAMCAAMVALCSYALLAPIIDSPRLRALAAFIAAQSALLYGYSMWGGIKELTLAFLLALTVASAVDALKCSDAGRPREVVPLALTAGALIDVIGPGAAVYVVPLLGLVAAVWLWRARVSDALRLGLARVGALAGLTLLFALPILLIVNKALSYETPFTGTQPNSEAELGNLLQPLSAFQLGGIWPVHDFRLRPATLPTVLLLTVLAGALVGALIWSYRRRRPGVAVYVGLAILGCTAAYLYGATPWVVGKTLAFSSPALPLAAMMGAALLWGRSRLAGGLVIAIIAGGVIWSNALAYHDVTLAPRPRLAELERIGTLLAGKGPTFVNEYEKYAEQHFLRDGAPIQMSRHGIQVGNLEVGDIDFFPLSRVEAYRSIVTRRSPVESRPPSIYKLIWQGRYYQVWQRPAQPARRIIEHIALGNPVATPPCAQIRSLARRALAEHAQIVAYQRPAPLVGRADQTVWPDSWTHDPAAHKLTATTAGQAIGQIAVPGGQLYELWLDGSFDRGFRVSVDGRGVGEIEHELSVLGAYVHLADVFLAPGVHTFVFTYPHADLTPGSGNNEQTSLIAIALKPHSPPSELIEVAPRQSAGLCGRSLDWIELVGAPS
jgi:hypothetical protein